MKMLKENSKFSSVECGQYINCSEANIDSKITSDIQSHHSRICIVLCALHKRDPKKAARNNMNEIYPKLVNVRT